MSIARHITGLQHIGIPTNDMKATIAFYEALGFTIAYETVAQPAGEAVCFLTLQGICIETYENHQGVGHAGAIDHIALDVDDIEATLAAVKAAGYCPIEPEIQALPFWANGVRYFNIWGPNMEKVEFSQML
ncbi:MAG: VOC family protein [Pseudoflavonifractor sp.]